jgi:hypothetical protein
MAASERCVASFEVTAASLYQDFNLSIPLILTAPLLDSPFSFLLQSHGACCPFLSACFPSDPNHPDRFFRAALSRALT